MHRSWNISHSVDADVLCLQEVVRSSGSSADWLLYRDGDVELPQRAHLFDEICTLLPDYDGFFCPTACGELFDGERVVLSQSGWRHSCAVRFPSSVKR